MVTGPHGRLQPTAFALLVLRNEDCVQLTSPSQKKRCLFIDRQQQVALLLLWISLLYICNSFTASAWEGTWQLRLTRWDARTQAVFSVKFNLYLFSAAIYAYFLECRVVVVIRHSTCFTHLCKRVWVNVFYMHKRKKGKTDFIVFIWPFTV